MSFSETFEGALAQFLKDEFKGYIEIDTQPLNTPSLMMGLAEKWRKSGARLREQAITTEDRYAVFQIQSLGMLMLAVSYAVPKRRER
jgi:hypothetical protein